MPRDLFVAPPSEDLSLTASPESQSSIPGGGLTATGKDGYNEFTIHRDEPGEMKFQVRDRSDRRQRINDTNDLHPYVQILSSANVDSCVALENSVFPENERCSRDKFVYRLTVCPELSLGLFSTVDSSTPAASVPTYASARPPDSASPDKKSVLVAQVIATRCTARTVTDESMNIPSTSQPAVDLAEFYGHHEHGRTIAVHSLAVLPAYQGQGLGKTIIKAYMQRMNGSGIADRIALLAHDQLVGFYEGVGFKSKGTSEVKFGGGGWTDMVYEFAEQPAS